MLMPIGAFLFLAWMASRLVLGAMMNELDIPDDFKQRWPHLLFFTISEIEFCDKFIFSGRYKEADIKPSLRRKTQAYVLLSIASILWLVGALILRVVAG